MTGESELFQNTSKTSNELSVILQEELDSFSSVLKISQKIAGQVDKLPISMLTEMVNYRQEWIEKIQQLEEKRKSCGSSEENSEVQDYMKKISDLAEKLVKIDDKIYLNLQNRKLKFVKEHAAVSGEVNYSIKHKRSSGGTSSKVDITQE
jgi:hypothetical protein